MLSYTIAQTATPNTSWSGLRPIMLGCTDKSSANHCGGPLKGGEGQFILKYFLVDRPRKQLKPSRVK